jgi:hypothetical protein
LAGDRWEMRRLIREVAETEFFTPAETAEWEKAYLQYNRILENKIQQTE